MSLFERIMREIPVGTTLKTPVMNKPFTVKRYENDAVVFSVGVNHSEIPIPKKCWDEVPNFLRGKGWVEIGAKHDVAEKGTLNEYLDTHHIRGTERHPDWGSYVPSVLERLGIVEVYHHRRSKLKMH
jgi:hypothetical protein